MVLKVVAVLGKLDSSFAEIIEEVGDIGVYHLNFGVKLSVFFDNGKTHLGGTAAVVADSVEEENFFDIALGGIADEFNSFV